jgi:small-conductance mechanosensitive channel
MASYPQDCPVTLRLSILWLAGTLIGAGAGFAQESALAEARRAPVVIDGEPLFYVRGVTSQPAEERARLIEGRIRGAAANPKVSLQTITLDERAQGTWILADGHRLMMVLDEDAAMEEVARMLLADAHRTRIASAIEAYRQERLPRAIWMGALYSVGLTLALIAAAWIGRGLAHRLRAAVEGRYRRHLEGLEHRAAHLVSAEQVWRALAGILTLGWGVAMAVMVYAYLSHVLKLFPWTRGFGRSLHNIAVDPLRTMAVGFLLAIPNLVFLAILVVVVRYALRVIRIGFDGIAAGTLTVNGFDSEWAWPTYRLVRSLVIMFGLVVAYPYIPGSESGAFKGISLFIGVIFSLGSSSLIGNFVAGYSMTYRRTFRVGDRVKIGDQVGEVEQVGLLVTRLRSPKNEEVVVPNSAILASQVVNHSSMAEGRGLILHTTVGIGYETPRQQVEAILLEAAARTPGLSGDRQAFVLTTALGDFAVTYELNVFCAQPKTMERTYGELHNNILDVFAECGVQIMTPAYERDPDEPKVPPPGEWRKPAARAATGAATAPARV